MFLSVRVVCLIQRFLRVVGLILRKIAPLLPLIVWFDVLAPEFFLHYPFLFLVVSSFSSLGFPSQVSALFNFSSQVFHLSSQVFHLSSQVSHLSSLLLAEMLAGDEVVLHVVFDGILQCEAFVGIAGAT